MTVTTKVNVEAQAIEAKKASKQLMILSKEEKNEALLHLADVLEREYESILQANEKDLANGREQGFSDAFMDRLSLSKERVEEFAQGLRGRC